MNLFQAKTQLAQTWLIQLLYSPKHSLHWYKKEAHTNFTYKILFTATVGKYIINVVQDQDRKEKVVNVSQIYGNYDNVVNVQSVKQNWIYWGTFLRGSGWKSHAILFDLDNIFYSLDNSVGVEATPETERAECRVQVYCKFILLAVFAMFGPVLQSTAGGALSLCIVNDAMFLPPPGSSCQAASQTWQI